MVDNNKFKNIIPKTADGCIVDENLNTDAEAMEDRALQEKGIMEHRVPQKGMQQNCYILLKFVVYRVLILA